MSLPPELRVLCRHFSSTPVAELPRLTPTLLRQVLRCHVPLSSPVGNPAKTDASSPSVLVHKLKTQLSTLLNGKSPEGRFTAVVLIKAVVEVGGWEVLRGSESWVRGLLSILGKPDSTATKELCIIALTKIYCMTHQYQSLVREITTPTLPTFVTACLNLISSKQPTKLLEAPQTLVDTIFQSFALLIPRHTTIYRPFASQIRILTKPFLASTQSDGVYESLSVRESARRLVVILHQTVAKGGGGEEWGKSFRQLLKDIHVTADNVFRGVIEDWESTAGYVPESIDINQEASGGGRTPEDLPLWSGIDAGVERLTGLLELLSMYFKVETSTPVAIPLGSVMDLVMRVLSVSIPTPSESSTGKGGPRLHPAIDRDEKDSLWSGMPQVYVATLQLVKTIADRLEDNFVPLSHAILSQLTWVFPFGRHYPEFRQAMYTVTAKILLQNGQSLNKSQSVRLTSIIRSCCGDLQGGLVNTSGDGATTRPERNGNNADTFLYKASETIEDESDLESDLAVAAADLLPLFLSHLPQQYLDISLRSLIERTAILTRNKGAMLASVLSPFVGKNGNPLASIVPHLTREFGDDALVEILLRPRMPLVPAPGIRSTIDSLNSVPEDEEMESHADSPATQAQQQNLPSFESVSHTTTAFPQASIATPLPTAGFAPSVVEPHTVAPATRTPNAFQSFLAPSLETHASPSLAHPPQDTTMTEDLEEPEDSSDDASVHLTMQLDSDSEED